MSYALEIRKLSKAFGGLKVTQRRQPRRGAGRAPPDHRPERRRQDDAVQPDHRRDRARRGLGPPDGPRHHAGGLAPARAPGHVAHLSDHHAVPARHHRAQRDRWRCSGCRRCAGTRSSTSTASTTSSTGARSALDKVGLGHLADRPLSETSLRRAPPRRDRDGAGAEPEGAAARRALCRAVDRRAAGRAGSCSTRIPRDVTIVMIEHNMDVALDFADRITLLNFGEVIVEGTRAEVVADPRTQGGLPWPLAGSGEGRGGGCDCHASTALATPAGTHMSRPQPSPSNVDAYYGDSHVLHGVAVRARRGPAARPARPQRRRQDDVDERRRRPRAAAARAASRCSARTSARFSPGADLGAKASRWCRRAAASSRA